MKITLALGGGGVKGFAHIGAIRVLEREGYSISGIAGSSAGGLVGALYAAGYSADQMETSLKDIDLGNLFAHMHGDAPSLLGFAGVTALLTELLGSRSFNDLRLPLAITATDLNTGLPVLIQEGRIIDALLATSAVPGVFPARSLNGHLLVDGCIMNPIPVAAARELYPEGPVIAVVLSPALGWQQDSPQNGPVTSPLFSTNLPLVYRIAGRLRLGQAFKIFITSMDLTGQMLLDKQLQIEKPEVIIRPKIGQVGIVDRVNIPELIKSGELAAQEALPEIRKALSWSNRLSRRLSRLLTPDGG
jgi:NTE family protein